MENINDLVSMRVESEVNTNCECCWNKAAIVHCLVENRIWNESEDDVFINLCERCYEECISVNWYKISTDETTLRKRFLEVKNICNKEKLKIADFFWNFSYNKIPEWIDVYSFELLNEKFAKDKNHVYDGGWICTVLDHKYIQYNFDPNTFEILGNWYIKDKNLVYTIGWDWCYHLVDCSDVKTFHVIDKHYTKDKNHVYYNWRIIQSADPISFQSLGYSFSRDSKWLYQYGKVLHVLHRIDLDSISIIDDTYIKDKNGVYLIKNWGINKCLSSFERINDTYIKDKNYVYRHFDWEIIKWADPSSFEEIWYNYYKDSKAIYYWWKILEWVDYNSFRIINNDFAKDKNFIYTHGNIFTVTDYNTLDEYNFDPNTFEVLGNWYIKDSKAVYYWNRKIDWVNLESFKVINEYFCIDNKNVFFIWSKIELLDPNTFEIIDEYFVKDSTFILQIQKDQWMSIKILKWIDPLTFKRKNNFILDKEHVYDWDWNIIEWSDPESFELIDSIFQKDKVNYYYNWYKIDWVNSESFEQLRNNYISYYDSHKKNIIIWPKILDNTTVESINSYFSKDKYFIYNSIELYIPWDKDYCKYQNSIIRWMNISNIENIDEKYVKDRNFVYNWDWNIIAWADPNSFTLINDDFAKDDKNVYVIKKTSFLNIPVKTLEWIIPKDFQILDNNFFRDKNNVYSYSFYSNGIEYFSIWEDPNNFNPSEYEKTSNYHDNEKDDEYCDPISPDDVEWENIYNDRCE